MPEGDTLFRTAAGLRPHLVGRVVMTARARLPGPRISLVVGSTVSAVEAAGKNLLIRLENGLEIRTHLGMRGSWHRYRPGEPWRRPPARAALVLEVPGTVAVCFDAPTVELMETRAERLHAPLAGLGPDLAADDFDRDEALRRIADPAERSRPIAEVLLDQRVLAGIGNVYKSEILFIERVDPAAPAGSLGVAVLGRIVDRARTLLLANRGSVVRVTTGPAGGGSPTAPERAGAPERGPVTDRPVAPSRDAARDRPVAAGRSGRLWVYGRAGRPCRRCGTRILARRQGELPRTTYWCPRCQGPVDPAPPITASHPEKVP